MTTLRSAARGLLRVGVLLLAGTVGAAVLTVPAIPAAAAAAIGGLALGTLLLALIGWTFVGVVLAIGTAGDPGLVGRSRIARAAGIAFGVGQIVPLVFGTVLEAAGVPIPAAVWDLALAVIASAATVAVVRGGVLRGADRWVLAPVAAAQLLVAALDLLPSTVGRPSIVHGLLVPAALLVAGAVLLRAARRESLRTTSPVQVVTRAGRSAVTGEVAEPLHVAVDRERTFLAGQRRFTVVRFDRTDTAAELELSASPGWAVWGARIFLRLEAVGTDRTRVDAAWSPLLVGTILTWDQGERDLHAIVSPLAGERRAEAGLPVG